MHGRCARRTNHCKNSLDRIFSVQLPDDFWQLLTLGRNCPTHCQISRGCCQGSCAAIGRQSSKPDSADSIPYIRFRYDGVTRTAPPAILTMSPEESAGLIELSRGSAVVLLIEFLCYIYFFYWTHVDMREDSAGSATHSLPEGLAVIAAPLLYTGMKDTEDFVQEAIKSQRKMRSEREAANNCHPKQDFVVGSSLFNLLLLVIATTSLTLSSLFMFESIHAPTHYLSESFVGLVLMPCVLASLESATDALRSRQGMVWVAEGAFGATIRVSLCVLPVAVLLGWAVGKEMDMVLDGFQVAILTLSVLMVNHVINSISVHWYVANPSSCQANRFCVLQATRIHVSCFLSNLRCCRVLLP